MKYTKMLTREAALAQRGWFIIDAGDQILGRVATQAANLLRGKGKASFTPHVDCGDFVVVVNAAKVRVTGAKETDKRYYRHSGYPGGLSSMPVSEMRERHPDRLVRIAVEGMLPKNRLGRQLASKLKVYEGGDHPHAAQQPQTVDLASGK
jgi:large subunit ribosomal protein L13